MRKTLGLMIVAVGKTPPPKKSAPATAAKRSRPKPSRPGGTQTNNALPGKLRPALLLAPLPSGRHDWLVCMISSQLAQAVAEVDEIIKTNDADFAETGLKSASGLSKERGQAAL